MTGFQVLSKTERTASIYTLLQHSDQDQKHFFIALLQHLVKAENGSALGGKQDAFEIRRRRRRIGLIAFSDNTQLKAKPFARGLRPPSLNLPVLGSPTTPRFPPATSKGESFAGPAGPVNTPAFNKSGQDGDGSGATLNVPGVGPLTPQALNMVANSGLSAEAQLLAIQLVMNGLAQPGSPQGQGTPKSAKKYGSWRPPASAKYPGSALRHSALRSAGLKSAGLRSAGLKSGAPDSAMEGGVTPKEEDFSPEVLDDIPAWLRGLRLHKYTACFDGLTWQEMVALDDEALEKKGIVTVGARRRLLRTFEIVKKKMGMECPAGGKTDGGDAERLSAAMSKLSADSPVFVPRELRG